jgi:hypothetical protein
MKTLSEKQAAGMTRAQRYRARKAGIVVPKFRPGPEAGSKQSEEWIEKRKRWAEDHHAWKGEEASVKAGRSRALRRYPLQPCSVCGKAHSERHHLDGNTMNNEPDNILFVCRKCHMAKDGRLEQFRDTAKRNQPKAVAARWR